MNVLKLFEPKVRKDILDLYFFSKGSKPLIPKQAMLASVCLANAHKRRCFYLLLLSENVSHVYL